MDKIKMPFQYNADDTSVRDANFKLICRIGGELFLSVPECDQVGNQIANALNTTADQSRVIAVLTESLQRIDLRINSQGDHDGRCAECNHLLNRIGDDAENALAEAKRIQEGK